MKRSNRMIRVREDCYRTDLLQLERIAATAPSALLAGIP
jgi:hypothetical protein